MWSRMADDESGVERPSTSVTVTSKDLVQSAALLAVTSDVIATPLEQSNNYLPVYDRLILWLSLNRLVLSLSLANQPRSPIADNFLDLFVD